MSGRRTWVVASRVAQQIIEDRRTLVYIFALPALVTLLLGYVLRSTEGRPLIAVTGLESTALTALPAAPGAELVTLDEAEARRRFEDGGVDAIIAIRAGDGGRIEATVRAGTYQIASAVRATALRLASILALDPAARPARPLPVDLAYTAGGDAFEALDYNAPGIIGFFPFMFVFILTTVSFLRERTLGTLERLLVTPLRRIEMSAGYMIGFGGFALAQSAIIVGVALLVLDVNHNGPVWSLFVVAILAAVGAVNLGIFLSTYASTELQAVQFTPLVVVPQGLLGGLIFPLSSLPDELRVVAHFMPLTYATDALQRMMVFGDGALEPRVLLDLLALVGFASLLLGLASLTVRRQVG